MHQKEIQTVHAEPNRTIKSLVNTPLKKIMFGIQILSYFLIPGSPLIGGILGRMFDLSAGQIAGLILGIFIAGEILFYGSLAFLGKELILLIRDKLRIRRSKKFTIRYRRQPQEHE